MLPLWYQGLSDFFHEKLEKQELVDVVFRCKDGCVGGHQLILALASNFLSEILSINEMVESETVLLVPDLTLSQVSTFLNALYGGPLPTHENDDFRSFVEIVELFRVDLSSKVDLDKGQVTFLEPSAASDDDDGRSEEEKREFILPGQSLKSVICFVHVRHLFTSDICLSVIQSQTFVHVNIEN